MNKKLIDDICRISFFDTEAVSKLLKKHSFTKFDSFFDGTMICNFSEFTKDINTLFIVRFRPIGVMSNRVGDDMSAAVLGKVKEEIMSDNILYNCENPIAVLRKKEKCFVMNAIGNANIKSGSIYEPKRSFVTAGDRAYVNDISAAAVYMTAVLADQRSGEPIVALVNESLSGEGALSEVVSKVKPGRTVVISFEAETDNFKTGKGFGTVFKDGCYVAPQWYRNAILNKNNGDEIQYYIGKTDTGLEKVSISESTGGTFGIYIPIIGKDTRVCEFSLNDVEKAAEYLRGKDSFLGTQKILKKR